ncbi:hypothetical protein [Caulobacter sp. CCG-8]|uniref:terminase small subunit-like protein n=1 Tax=Caulobacter sp. CCG-8 TaxID=3127958 RepID=UPI00307CECC5
MGRPSEFSQEIADTICEGIANGDSLRAICESEDMPDRATVFRWLASPRYRDFRDQYACAREFSGDADADDVAHYARQAAEGKIEPAAATAAINGLKWSAGKRRPKVYGEKVALVGGDPEAGDQPIQTAVDVSNLTLDQLRALAAIPISK